MKTLLSSFAVCLLGISIPLASHASTEPAVPHMQKHATPQHIVFFGDSLTAGLGLKGQYSYPSLIQDKINALGLDDVVENAGVSGETSAQGVIRIQNFLKTRTTPIDIFVLELGANDGLQALPVAPMKQNLQTIIDDVKAKFPEVRVVLIGMKMKNHLGASYSAAYQQAFAELAQDNHVSFVPFLLEGVAKKAALNLPDGLHPNIEGQRVVAENVWPILKPLLTEN